MTVNPNIIESSLNTSEIQAEQIIIIEPKSSSKAWESPIETFTGLPSGFPGRQPPIGSSRHSKC